MNDQIAPLTAIRDSARRAFHAGQSRDDHNMNWHALALPTWQAEHDRLTAEAKHQGQRRAIRTARESRS